MDACNCSIVGSIGVGGILVETVFGIPVVVGGMSVGIDMDGILDGSGSMPLMTVGVEDDLSYDIKSLELDGDEVSVIGCCGKFADATGVSIESISCSIVSIEGNGEFLVLRRRPSSSIWLILVGKRSVGGDVVIVVALRCSIFTGTVWGS